MALAYLIDEHLRGPLWIAIQRHNAKSEHAINALRVGDPGAPPLGADDSELLQWAEVNDRVLVTLDASTMPTHLAEHVNAGRHSPGVFTIRPASVMLEVIEFLALAAHASETSEWENCVNYLP